MGLLGGIPKTQSVTKHVDGTVFPYLDASSNLTSSTKKASQISFERISSL